MVDETELAIHCDTSVSLTARDIRSQVNLVQEVMGGIMKEHTHYDKIPGCGDKPTLLQPGAQVLALTFQLAPEYRITRDDLGNGHREYSIICDLISRQSGLKVGSGVGSCSTMESKFRYRTGEVVYTGKKVPQEYWDDRDVKLIGGKGYSVKKNPESGQWEIVRQGEKVENTDIADTYNTVLKMGKKRAFVDAVLNTTAASDMFTQDIEDLPPTKDAGKANDNESTQSNLNALRKATGEYLKANPDTSGSEVKQFIEESIGCPIGQMADVQLEEAISLLKEPALLTTDIEF